MNGALVTSFEGWRDHIIEEKQIKSKALKVELNPWHRTNQTSSTGPCSVCARLIYVYIYIHIYTETRGRASMYVYIYNIHT